jgi:hypothetical protein
MSNGSLIDCNLGVVMNKFILSLLKTHEEHKDKSLSRENKEIMNEFLELGSETEDNINCVNHIEYGFVDETDTHSYRTYGLKIKNTDILLSSIAHTIEDISIPENIKEDFPAITHEQWSAATRMITMIIFSLEHRNSSGDK